MKQSIRCIILALAALQLLFATVEAACSSNLVVDDFSQWSTNTNSLGSWTSDDGSMTSISASSDKLSFSPNPSAFSYFYTTFSCVKATTDKYNAITFPLKGPSGTSFTLEVQYGSCTSETYSSKEFTVSGLTGSTQTITIPLSAYGLTTTQLDTIKSWVWQDFSSTGTYEMGKIEFVCTGAGSGSTTISTTSTSTSGTTSPSGGSTSIPASPSTTATAPTGACTNLLIDDWVSQSRLTFLYYNAMLQPSSDDGTMASIVVAGNRVSLTPKSGGYFYSQVGCLNAANTYGGIGLRIKAPSSQSFSIAMQSSSSCSPDNPQEYSMTTASLGFVFDGTEKIYYIPFSKFSGLDTTKITGVVFSSFKDTQVVTFGPMAFYCGTTGSEYQLPPTSTTQSPTSTIPVTTGTAAALVIDQFTNSASNALGFWHGGDDEKGLTYSGGTLTIKFTDSDYAYYTQLTGTCRDMNAYKDSYLHIAYTGSNKFSIALQQHNTQCNNAVAPYPETWDEVEAARYATATDIYVPMSHFSLTGWNRVVGIALRGFYSSDATILSKIEIVKTVPSGFTVPAKVPTAPVVFACSKPNSFAFAIDDGDPALAQKVMQIVKEAGIKVTFFTVGAALLDASTNLTNVYKDMMAQGHQVAYHSFTHPKMEGLPTIADIDWEIQNDVDAVTKQLGISSTKFRPPFGNEGARFRQRAAALIPGASLINWSVDVEDWLWAQSDTPEKQLDAFKRDVAKGGNLVVLHYLYTSTVSYLPQFIQLAKATGKNLMTVEECLS